MTQSSSWWAAMVGAALAAPGFVVAVPGWAAGQAESLHGPGVFGPMSFLRTFGSPGQEIQKILWGLAWLSIAVVVIFTALVVIGVMRRARRVEEMSADTSSVSRDNHDKALRWIYAGVAVTVGILLFFITWTVSTMAAIQAPNGTPAVTLEVTGHQWWWEVAYKGDDGATRFETANEIRVPVGRPVKILLRSADVIHSFWVPLMAGKTDLIPGQENVAWLRADAAGVYRGQCLEYCGLQHAHMALQLVAVPPEEFEAWLAQQAEPAHDGAQGPPDSGGPAGTEAPAAIPGPGNDETR